MCWFPLYTNVRAQFVDALVGRHLAPVFILVGTIQTAMFPVYSPLQAIVKTPPTEIKELYA